MSLSSINQIIMRASAAISATEQTPSIALDRIDGPIFIQAVWDTGVTNDFDLVVEVSADNSNWSEIAATRVNNITSTSGSQIWEVTTGAAYIRVKIERNAGSKNLGIQFNGRRSL